MGHTYTRAMLDTHPLGSAGLDPNILVTCIEQCFACAQACTACADADLSEQMVAELARCARLDLDCADICETTGRALSRQTSRDVNLIRALVQACVTACKVCGDECERHAAMHEHCRVNADACRRCETACQDLLAVLG
ncbi:four-helix bundle copper-binding protein [Micromonospora sp. U56]|uniref:four-helix bundle copper-binding protein n=1 Tax=Micromonospora sp. U56 TaxID=2824900 RepID=UPI001B39C9CE|nr:four-helix bundle copper-binding protein [Micromonospora sp. U56]MBQ0892050.1 four-helix bundle copper-binding protein [Micromonospora sp. U56]